MNQGHSGEPDTFVAVSGRFEPNLTVRRPIFIKAHPVTNFQGNPAAGTRRDTCGRTEGHEEVESSWNVIAHGDARETKCGGNWRMQWVASTLHTTSERGVSNITTADAHTSAASSRVNWRTPGPI